MTATSRASALLAVLLTAAPAQAAYQTTTTAAGPDTPGAAPTQPPLFVAGVDPSGNIKPFTLTAAGLALFSDPAAELSLSQIKTALGSPFQAGGSIGNTGFAINGTLPAFAVTPTVNLGTLGGAATDASLQQVKTALGSPMQVGGNIGNTAFGISGTLPAFATIPAFRVDQTAPGQTNKVTLGADIVTVGGQGGVATAFFQRTTANTTTYATGQLVANSTTPSGVVPMQFTVVRQNGGTARISRVCIAKTTATTIAGAAGFRMHLYNAPPVAANGDGGPWLTSGALNWVGAFDVVLDKAFTDGAKGCGPVVDGSAYVTFAAGASSTTLYGLIEARAAYTPGSGEIFTGTIELDKD